MKGTTLKQKLKELKISQVEFSLKCGVSEVQISKWINEHSDVPQYAKTIINLLESEETEHSIKKLTKLASVLSDGHYTICKFTTNYRVRLGTPADRKFIDEMSEGTSIENAISNLFDKVQKVSSY